MTVYWTRNAKAELRAIHDYIAQNSPRYAQGMVDRITRKTQQLASQPQLGAIVPQYSEASIRELLVYPYRILYRTAASRVEVLSVVHGARQLPPDVPTDP
jgi:toxin ParE1/3/4